MKKYSTIRKRVFTGLFAAAMAASAFAMTTTAIADDKVDTEVICQNFGASEVKMPAANTVCTEQQNEKVLILAGCKFCKRNGEYYIVDSPALDGEMPLREYGMMLQAIIEAFDVEVAITFANSIIPDPSNQELLRIWGPWGVVDHYERMIDDTSNPWEI